MTDPIHYQKLLDFQGTALGYAGSSHWAVRKPHVLGELTPANRKKPLSWLPLLEGEYVSFQQAAQAGLLHANPGASLVDFPLHDLLAVALSSHDDYWARRGLVGAEAAQKADELRAELALLMAGKRVSQATRHAAKRRLFASPAQKK